MVTLNNYVAIDRRGKVFFELPRTATLAEKGLLIEQFLALHVGRKYWSIRMHTTKRRIFPLHGTISFRATKPAVGKLVVLFDQTTVGRTMEEVTLVWDKMRPFLLTSGTALKQDGPR